MLRNFFVISLEEDTLLGRRIDNGFTNLLEVGTNRIVGFRSENEITIGKSRALLNIDFTNDGYIFNILFIAIKK